MIVAILKSSNGFINTSFYRNDEEIQERLAELNNNTQGIKWELSSIK